MGWLGVGSASTALAAWLGRVIEVSAASLVDSAGRACYLHQKDLANRFKFSRTIALLITLLNSTRWKMTLQLMRCCSAVAKSGTSASLHHDRDDGSIVIYEQMFSETIFDSATSQTDYSCGSGATCCW